MKRLIVYLKTGKNVVHLDKYIRTCPNSTVCVRNASIFWYYQNVTQTSRVATETSSITFLPGYWTFHMIKDHFADNGIKLVSNRYNNTCKIYSENSDLNTRHFGKLLGFAENEVITKKTWVQSSKIVDVNLGLRYVRVSCDAVEMGSNFEKGKGSKVLATFSVTTEQSLDYSVTHYKGIQTEAPIANGDHQEFEFFVDTNLGETREVEVEVMLELYF